MTSHQEKPEGSETLAADTSPSPVPADASAADTPESSKSSSRRTAARSPRRSGDTVADASASPRKRRSRRTADDAAAETAPGGEAETAASSSDSLPDAPSKTPSARKSRKGRSAAVAGDGGAESDPSVEAVAPAEAGGAEGDASPAPRARAVKGRTSRKRTQPAAPSPAEGSVQEEIAAPTSATEEKETGSAGESAAAPRRTARSRKKAVTVADGQTAGPDGQHAADTPAPDGEAPAGAEGGASSVPGKTPARGKKRGSATATAAQESVPEAVFALEQQDILPPALQEKSRVPALRKEALPVPVSAAPETEAAEDAGDAASSSAPGEEEGVRRKSRRGRRGGRGRNRKNRQGGEAAETPSLSEIFAGDDTAEDVSSSTTTDEAEEVAEGGESAEPVKKGGVRAAAVKAKAASSTGRQRMFISILPGEQVEVALAEEGVLLEYYLDMLHQKKLKGNIYKGVIHNIDTNLQAAFVSYGAGKNGFLQIDEVHPEYWLTHHEPAKGKKYPPIQKVLKAGQEVLVQVVKEPNGSKGAFLTTWLSLAGRFLVLTPGQEQIGVSRKVDNDEERARLREMMNGIDPGEGLGVIVRTVSAGVTKTILRSDLQYLKRVWKDIRKKATEVTAPALIHEEPGLPERAVRDYLTDDVCEIWVDNEALAESIRDTVSQLFPRKKDLVRLHSDTRHTLWERFNLRRQLDQIYSREVTLPSGGRLVFDQTEALMAVDINSGKISGKVNFESMAFKTNVEAAETIARQLKLRDVGGQVVIDFIEMRDRKHILEVEKTLRTAMKNDRARHDVGRMSSFGLLELVRQRMGSSALAISMEPCPHCNGTGQRRNREWQALQALRELRSLLRSCQEERLRFETTAEVGMYLLNHKRDTLRDMENSFGKSIEICLRP